MRLCNSAIRICVSILVTAAFLFIFTPFSSAQAPTGTILGVVKDSSGAVVPGATVTVQSSETNQTRSAVTDSGGAYRVNSLPVGHYDVKVEQSGFKTQTQTGLNLEVGQEAVIDIALQVGSAEQTVQVTGEAQQVNTTNSTLGTVVSEQTIADLPLNGRNYNDLTLLQPGITQQKSITNAGGKQPGTAFSSNGAPFQSNSYILDGASLISMYNVSAASGTGNTLGVDGIREYKVVTNNLSAEYGMTMGAQVLLVSKSGTNSFHGDAFEFLRNSVLDAANYFDSPTAANNFQRTPPFRRNNFGGAMGGPIRKDKTFFFGAYEALRENIGQTIVTGTIPSNCFGLTNNPCATASGAGNNVKGGAVTILPLFPKPNLPVGCLNSAVNGCSVTYPFSEPITENWGQGRVDHTFSASDSIYGRYTFDDSFFSFGLGYSPFTQSEPTRSQFGTVSENHVFSSALLNTFRFSYSRTSAHVASPSNFPPFNFNLLPGQQNPGFGTIQISGVTVSTQGGGFGPGSSLPNAAIQNIYTWSDDIFYVKGKHSFKFGMLINRYQQNMYNDNASRGTFSFSSLANFLAGNVSSGNVGISPTASDAVRYERNSTYGVYAQDDFRVLPTLTLNFGLRYEFATVVSDKEGKNVDSTPTCAYPCFQVGPMYRNPYLHNFSPRVGFAWDVFGNGKTSVRGGGALLYDVETLGETIFGTTDKQPPFGNYITLGPTTFTIPISLAGSVNNAENNPSTGLNYNLKGPKSYQWNLTVERQLPWSMALQVSYVGSRGIHLLQDGDANPTQFVIQNGQPFWSATAPRVLNPTWGAFGVVSAIGDSNYNALEIGVTKRVSRGLQFQSEYTYSKLIDDGDGNAPSQATSTSDMTITQLDERLDRSLASYDIRNNYRFNTIYNLPTFNSSNGFVRGMINGWWTAVILSAQSGYPFTPSITQNRSRSRTGAANPGNLDRPDWLPGRNPYNATHGGSSGCTLGSGTSAVVVPAGTPLGSPTLFFDPCAFTLEPVGYEGNVGRNSLIGPGSLDLDYSLVKDTSVKWLGEAGKIEFRAEVFNIMNHPNFAQPSRTVFSGTLTDGPNCPITGCPAGTENPVGGATHAGVIQSTANGTTATQSAGNSRQIQFGLKVVF